jgi:hypothetical protein
MNKKETAGSAVPSLTDVHEREEQDRPLYATRVIGQEVWKAEVLLTATGVSIGYIKRRKRAHLGFRQKVTVTLLSVLPRQSSRSCDAGPANDWEAMYMSTHQPYRSVLIRPIHVGTRWSV